MGRLIDCDDSVLIVVDAQPAFYRDGARNEPPTMAAAFDRAAWLAGVATALGVPAVVTEEDPMFTGPTAARILAALPDDVPVLQKPIFGAADSPDILAVVVATARRTAVLVGLETDVCVSHTALGLLDRGYRVAVVEDATYAPGPNHDAGIRRIAEAGALIVHAKGIYYEWVRTLDAARTFERDQPGLAKPPGFTL